MEITRVIPRPAGVRVPDRTYPPQRRARTRRPQHTRRLTTNSLALDVTVTHRTDEHRVRARVRTGPTLGDHERVTLQILAVCAR